MPITKIQYGGHQHFAKRISPYLSRELSKFDEIWYANAYFDTVEETHTHTHTRFGNVKYITSESQLGSGYG